MGKPRWRTRFKRAEILMSVRHLTAVLVAISSIAVIPPTPVLAQQLSGDPTDKKTIVFVCEHGSAKSVIAATHFNRIAGSKGLPYRAVSRGVHPDSEVPENIRSGLLADGFKGDPAKPKLIADEDIGTAARAITLGCELPKGSVASTEKPQISRQKPSLHWTLLATDRLSTKVQLAAALGASLRVK